MNINEYLTVEQIICVLCNAADEPKAAFRAAMRTIDPMFVKLSTAPAGE
jgi:hypothetical protein